MKSSFSRKSGTPAAGDHHLITVGTPAPPAPPSPSAVHPAANIQTLRDAMQIWARAPAPLARPWPPRATPTSTGCWAAASRWARCCSSWRTGGRSTTPPCCDTSWRRGPPAGRWAQAPPRSSSRGALAQLTVAQPQICSCHPQSCAELDAAVEPSTCGRPGGPPPGRGGRPGRRAGARRRRRPADRVAVPKLPGGAAAGGGLAAGLVPPV
jgi:hypothetical protein